MGKTARPTESGGDPPGTEGVPSPGTDTRDTGFVLSPEQAAKYKELRVILRQWIEEAERMTPEEAEQAEREWEVLKKSMNEERARAGARLLFLD